MAKGYKSRPVLPLDPPDKREGRDEGTRPRREYNGVEMGKERYGAKSSPGYGEPNRLVPNPYANQGENGYHFNPQDESSLDHWGGKSEATIMNPGDVDEDIWSKAKSAAEKEYGAGHYAAVSYIYQKMGGKFHRKS